MAKFENMKTNSTYHELLLDERWGSKRQHILERDNFRCRNCFGKEDLQIHHRQYHVWRETGNMVLPWEYKDDLLIALCKKCHQIGHEKYKIPYFEV